MHSYCNEMNQVCLREATRIFKTVKLRSLRRSLLNQFKETIDSYILIIIRLTAWNESEIQIVDRITKFFVKILSQRAYEEWECRFLTSQSSTIVSVLPLKYMRDIVSYPFLSGFIDSLPRFNMASPIAFRLGLKNAGRLASFLSLTPKVCLKHELVMTFQVF